MTDPRDAVIDRILSGQPGPVDTDEPGPVDLTANRRDRRDRYARAYVLRALREQDPTLYRRLYRAAAAEWERANPKETP